jgi:hypothetical protein
VDKVEFMSHVENRYAAQKESFYELVKKAVAQAMNDGIKANSIVINEKMVKVPETWIRTPLGARELPRMICGLNVYLTTDELPENYSFAVLEGPNNRLAQFESIGMEPDELRKAAEMYRRVKEVME